MENNQELVTKAIIQRIISLKKPKESDSAFAERCGIKQSTFSGYINQYRAPSAVNLMSIAKENSVTVDWLINGDGRETWKYRKENEQGFRGEAQPIRQIRKVPVISWVQAGGWVEAVDLFQPGYAEEYISFDEPCGPNTFALVVNGESMSPDFPPGMRIIVDPSLPVENGDLVVAKNGDNEVTFKKIVFEGEKVLLYPLNSKFLPPRDMTGKELHVIGIVIGRYEALRWSRRR